MKYEVVIGLEVHAELSTGSKIFCGCSTEFGGEPNTRVCPVCAGMPGTLPRLNRAVIDYAVRLGLALNCEITRRCKFDRKNYFYPDLPKAYQVSQLYLPICRDGSLEIESDSGMKTITIREIHMEEDAGKLIHEGGETYMDFNRCGVPLLEIVTQPDFRNADEVNAYLEKLREILKYLEICDCKMQEGSLRADVNLSVRRRFGESGEPEEYGVRTEMKNLNSFKAISRAIEYESQRQIELIESGGTVIQETRRWDDEKGESHGMRSKEDAQDYRYFPEPDLLPLEIDEEWLERIRANLPELAHLKRERYIGEYKLSAAEAAILTEHKNISDLFEAVTRESGSPIESARLLLGEVMRLMNTTNTLPEDLKLDPSKLSYLIRQVEGGKINRDALKQATEAVFVSNAEPADYIAENQLEMLSDDTLIAEKAQSVIDANPGAVEDYHNGKTKAFGFLMGQVMKQLAGSGNPEIAKRLLLELLQKT